MKRILTFDYRQDITTPSATEIRGLLDDMQRELDRKKSEEVSVPSFLGMPIVDPRILAAMGAVKTRSIEPLPIRKIETPQPEIPKKTLPPVIHVAQDVARTLGNHQPPAHKRFYPPVRPFL
jgi:hypothetical protein